MIITLKDQLRADLMTNFWARNELETTTLRDVIKNIENQEKTGRVSTNFSDEEVRESLAADAKLRRETAQEYFNKGNSERATRETAEAIFIFQYLPARLNDWAD